MEPIADQLFSVPGPQQAAVVIVRLVTAATLGGLLGAERESEGKPAGLRTHMLVALGAALFVVGRIRPVSLKATSAESFKASPPESDSSAPERF